MKVLIAFEFEGVDPNSPEGDEIVEFMTGSCEYLREKFDSTACYVDDVVSTEWPKGYGKEEKKA
jgi:hypothetical protein